MDKIRRVMHLVYSTAQANDLIPRTVEANPVTHVHIATTTGYEAILVTPQEAWNLTKVLLVMCNWHSFAVTYFGTDATGLLTAPRLSALVIACSAWRASSSRPRLRASLARVAS